MPPNHKKAAIVLAIGFTAIASLFVPPRHLSDLKIQQLRSVNHLRGIASLILDYRQRHGGRSPTQLSQLLEGNDLSSIQVFYSPNWTKSVRPADWSTNKDRIDSSGNYSLAMNSELGIIAFEKPGLWPDGSVAVAFADGHVARFSFSKYLCLFRKGANPPSDVLETGRGDESKTIP